MEEERLAEIFRPIYQERMQALNAEHMSLAYYTSATTGLNILRGRELWMRAAACMNDYREIDYGIQLLNRAIYGSEERRQRIRLLAYRLHWGNSMLEDLLGDLNHNENRLITKTYLACVSEHTEEENCRGRLSMWRAYGRRTGVAFVLRAAPLLQSRSELPLRITPVEYLDEAGFARGIDRMIKAVELHADEIQQADPAMMLSCFVETVLFSLFSIKHPGFIEEKEWRIVYQEMDERLSYDLVSVDGIPQIVYKVPVRGADEPGPGLQLEEMLDRIVIGPTQYADVVCAAFVRALEEMGITHASQRVCKSNIPLRQEK